MSVERIKTREVLRRHDGEPVFRQSDRVVVEEPLEIRLDDEPLAVVMRTPGHDIELVAGLLLAEEIVSESDDIATIAHCRDGDDPDLTNIVKVRLSAERRTLGHAMAKKAERNLISSSSCGVCGKKTIESLQSHAPPFDAAPLIDLDFIEKLSDRVRAAQEVFEATGGLHAAALFDSAGTLLVLREDVGRHNAVDKCVGNRLLHEALPIDGAVLFVSGRASFEIVQKALVARIQTIAAVSAPSSLAIELASVSNMGLCGFVRGRSMNVYAGDAK